MSPSDDAPLPLTDLQVECYGTLLLIRLHRQATNSFRLCTWDQLKSVITALVDSEVREFQCLSGPESTTRLFLNLEDKPEGVVIAGSKKTFSLGNDHQAWSNASDSYRELWTLTQQECCLQVKQLAETMPIAAALTGYTVGAAWDLAEACHYRVMGDNARLRFGRHSPFLGPSDALAQGYVEALAAPDFVLYHAQEWVRGQGEMGDLYDS